MSAILTAIGSWIAGCVVPAVEFIVEGVSIVASFLGSLSLGQILCIVLAIALITAAVITYYKNFTSQLNEKYEDAQLIDEKKVFEQLDAHKGESANIETKITFFEKEMKKEVDQLIKEENIEEKKKTSMELFVNSIVSMVSKAGKSGENKCQKSYDLYEESIASLNYVYNKQNHKIILSFSFYDEKIFEYLKVLIKVLKKKNYNLENKNYENDFERFYVDKDSENNYKIIINNIY